MEVFEENICSEESYRFINYIRLICNSINVNKQFDMVVQEWNYIIINVYDVVTAPESAAGAGPFI